MHIPAIVRNIADVSGAGDTVISTLSLAMAAGLDPQKAALLANLAGGLVCESVGVVPVNKTQLLKEAFGVLKKA
jgi:bifunctional ADP-heptose synthase (sugar kinase/adenylyltransferase)